MMNGYGMDGWGWAAMTLAGGAVLVLLGFVVWAILRQPSWSPHEASAREQLDARLASGAIGTQEYRERLEAMKRA